MDQPSRLHAFDNLRAVLMWLGILLHVALNHTTAPSPLPWRDAQTSLLADLILLFIHAFRMPAFFILAGFFVALLVARRGHRGMLAHRLRRLALPFAVFWPILFACTGVLGAAYLQRMAGGAIDIARLVPGAMPVNTMHMWFLYYLIWFCGLTAALAPLWARASARLQAGVDQAFLLLAARPWSPLFLALPLALLGARYADGMIASSGSFLPQPDELVHNGLFFVFGLLAHRHQDVVFPRFVRNCWRNAAAGLVVFVAVLGAYESLGPDPATPQLRVWIAYLYNLAGWLWSLALIGLFLRHVPHQNRVLRYISDSSYWVFLVHMLGTIGFGALLYNLPLGAPAKMALNVAATTLVSLLSYQLLVRHTAIGVLLNGTRPRTAAEVPAPASAPQV